MCCRPWGRKELDTQQLNDNSNHIVDYRSIKNIHQRTSSHHENRWIERHIPGPHSTCELPDRPQRTGLLNKM